MTWIEECEKIRRECAARHIDPYFVAAIRQAEGGGPGREFGILSVPANNFDDQLRVCTATISRYLAEFPQNPLCMVLDSYGHRRSAYRQAFVEYAGKRYAPQGAENDPKNLNRNWQQNVWNLYTGFLARGLP